MSQRNSLGKTTLPSTYTDGTHYMNEPHRTQWHMFGTTDDQTTVLHSLATAHGLTIPEPWHRYPNFTKTMGKAMYIIVHRHVFGPVRCNIHTAEWEKRGLPQAHILLWLRDEIEPTKIDKIIYAQFFTPFNIFTRLTICMQLPAVTTGLLSSALRFWRYMKAVFLVM